MSKKEYHDIVSKGPMQGAETFLSNYQPPSSITKATASLENSSICVKLNSSEISMRLRGATISKETIWGGTGSSSLFGAVDILVRVCE